MNALPNSKPPTQTREDQAVSNIVMELSGDQPVWSILEQLSDRIAPVLEKLDMDKQYTLTVSIDVSNSDLRDKAHPDTGGVYE